MSSPDPAPPDPGPAPAPPGGWSIALLGTLAEAEELLDLLERGGTERAELVILGDDRFAVRWRPARPGGVG